ncbi:LysR substrate-binding domain-containing protein [Sphingobium sp.]|uniref:LysR substrate-binding domain-containing protein n=1 Tax=Sphingobium sp. TaxID=1912891 RepID=UPI003BB5CDD2
MELRHLRYFAAVAKERNFTRAAEKLGVAQPPLSRQINDLELELGVILFDRSVRPIMLTQAGRLLLEKVTQILGSIDQIAGMMENFAATRQRRFVIGVVGSIMHGDLPEMIRRFRSHMPDMDVELVELTTLEQVMALKAGRIDAGLGRVRVDDPAIARRILCNEALIAALPSSDPLARDTAPLPLTALAGRSMIVYPREPRPSYADQVLALFHEQGTLPGRVTEVREIQTALGLVAAHSGIAIVPRSTQYIQRHDIVYRPLSDAQAVSPIILSQRLNDLTAESEAFRAIGMELFG